MSYVISVQTRVRKVFFYLNNSVQFRAKGSINLLLFGLWLNENNTMNNYRVVELVVAEWTLDR